MKPPPPYPFTAIVGQPHLQLALALLAIDPHIGGVLIRGEKGTAKSTAARAFATHLPTGIMRTLPLGATEDRITGTLDIQATLTHATPIPLPGILSEVHKGALYIDEINLLDEHLLNLILETAASGTARIEREGISCTHPAQFALIGTMNPEEGPLPDHALDRFGLCVDITSITDLDTRVLLLERTLAYETDPHAFAHTWAPHENHHTTHLQTARDLLPHIDICPEIHNLITTITTTNHVAGHRADIVLTQATRAHAAWHTRRHTTTEDVHAVAHLVLTHRSHTTPTPTTPTNTPPTTPNTPPSLTNPTHHTPPENHPTSHQPPPPTTNQQHHHTTNPDGTTGTSRTPQPTPTTTTHTLHTPLIADPTPTDTDTDTDTPATCSLIPLAGTTFPVIPLSTNTTNPHTPGRKNTPTTAHRGRYIRSRPARPNITSDLALDATIRAAAPHQRARNNPHGRIQIERSDWQEKIRQHHPGNCTIFIVDASGSMGAQNRMTAAKGAILSLLLDAYQKRNRVALITFHHRNAHILLPPTSSIELAGRLLTDLPIGGPTPLPTALTTTSRLLNTLLHKNPELRPLLILVSDGCANIDLDGDPTPSAINQAHHLATNLGKDPRTRWIVVDTENPTTGRLSHAAALAHALNAPCHTIDELHADDLLHLVRTQTPH